MKKISFLIFVIFVSRLESLPIENSFSEKPEIVFRESTTPKPEVGIVSTDNSSSKKPEIVFRESTTPQPEVGIVSADDLSSKKPETITKPFPEKVAIGLYSSQFLDLLLQMKIFPKVEHWPLADGRTISGTFLDETIFQGIIHSPNDPGVPDVKGKFTNLQPLGKVTLTLNEEEEE